MFHLIYIYYSTTLLSGCLVLALEVKAVQDFFGWKHFEQTPMLFYPSLKAQVWFGEEVM